LEEAEKIMMADLRARMDEEQVRGWVGACGNRGYSSPSGGAPDTQTAPLLCICPHPAPPLHRRPVS